MTEVEMQQINLYRPDKAPITIGIEFLHILVVWGGALLILGAISGYVMWQKSTADSSYSIARQAEMAAMEQLTLQQGIAGDTQDEDTMQVSINQLIAERNQLSATMDLLLGLGLERKGGFTPVFDALSERHVVGTWFTRILLQADGRYVSLSGSAIEAALVPDIFVALDKNALFEGRGFDSLQLTVDSDTNLVNFSMRSTTDR